MADQFFDTSEQPAAGNNVTELSVGEISQAIKRTLEGAFGRVRIRGEVGRPNYHGSGHLYFTLKDADAAAMMQSPGAGRWENSHSGWKRGWRSSPPGDLFLSEKAPLPDCCRVGGTLCEDALLGNYSRIAVKNCRRRVVRSGPQKGPSIPAGCDWRCNVADRCRYQRYSASPRRPFSAMC